MEAELWLFAYHNESLLSMFCNVVDDLRPLIEDQGHRCNV